MASRVEEAGKMSGTLVGVLSGAEIGTAAIPIPIFGTLVGAFVGGLVGNSAGQLLGVITDRGTSKVVDLFAVGLGKAALYGARRAEAAVPQPTRTEPPPPLGSGIPPADPNVRA